MYQNLRHLIDPESTKGTDTNSVHYLMLPQPKYAILVLSLGRLLLVDLIKWVIRSYVYPSIHRKIL